MEERFSGVSVSSLAITGSKWFAKLFKFYIYHEYLIRRHIYGIKYIMYKLSVKENIYLFKYLIQKKYVLIYLRYYIIHKILYYTLQ